MDDKLQPPVTAQSPNINFHTKIPAYNIDDGFIVLMIRSLVQMLRLMVL